MEAPLPSGTLTMLFSDIEGSTRLLSQLGDQYADLLSAQRSILRAAFEQCEGREMGTEGDSFFVVFESVEYAVTAAVAAQRGLGEHDWPSGATVKVRMGLHTGEPKPHEDGYVGMDVHRAARVAASAHGGQVVLSEATYRIAVAEPPSGVSFLGLGWHRLKDLPQAEHLYQAVADGLETVFPPLKSLGTRANLPTPAGAIVGRDGELRELHDMMTGSGVRLVTLTGAGGSGKTRLALAVASRLDDQFPDGVYFVPLAAVESSDVMWTTVAEVLGVSGEGRAAPTLLEHIKTRGLLLILDNLEQLPGAAPLAETLLAEAPGVSIIATSRRPLHVAGEHEHAVPPLTLPDRTSAGRQGIADSGAVRLFVQRAQMVRAVFALDEGTIDDVAEICRRLDGLPLAIEIAAARVKMLSPHALLARLDQSLEMKISEQGRPTRQQTLRNTIAWSYALLSPDQQQLFRQLGVFAGGFDLDAAAAVMGTPADPLDRIADLVDVSLVAVTDGPDGEPRIRLLQVIATYALERLAEAGELETVRRRHAEHYLAFAETVGPKLRSSQALSARDQIEVELDNLRAALSWCLAGESPVGPGHGSDEVVIGTRLCQALSWFWYAGAYLSEGRRWLEAAVAAATDRESPELTMALHGLAVLLLQQGELERAGRMLASCLDFWRRNGDASRISMELNSLAVAHRALGQADTARAMLEESIALARRVDDKGRLANSIVNLAMLETDEGAQDRAIDLLNEALVLDRELGDLWGQSVDEINLAGVMLRGGRIEDAFEQLCAHASSAAALSDVELTVGIVELFAMVFAERGDALAAARMLGASEAVRRKVGLPIVAPDDVHLERSMRKVSALTDEATWAHHVGLGAQYTVDQALAEAMGQPHDS